MLLRTITLQAQQTPSKIAVIQDGRASTYLEFATAIAVARAALSRQAFQPGTLVALVINELREGWIQGIALRSLGCITINLPSAKELKVLSAASVGAVLTSAQHGSPELIALASERGWPLLTMDAQIAERKHSAADFAQDRLLSGGHILLTSGTTGSSKMVLRTEQADARTLALHREINSITEHSVIFAASFALHTAGGYRWPLLAWSAGATVLFEQRPAEACRAMLSGELVTVTHAFATPDLLMQWLAPRELPWPRRDAMRLMVTGAALPWAVAQNARARLAGRLYSSYASTEALTVAMTPIDSPDDLIWHRVHPAREVQVVDDADQPLPSGELGRVRVRLLDGVNKYLGDPAASREFFHGDFFYTGDLGVLAGDGRLSLHGRSNDVININGNKLSLAQIEQRLQDGLSGGSVCIFALADAEGIAVAHVLIEHPTSIPEDQLRPLLAVNLGSLFHMVRCHFLATFPRNPMGKVVRGQLQQQLAERLAKL